MNEPTEPFDDPGLAAAIRAVCAPHQAPANVRELVLRHRDEWPAGGETVAPVRGLWRGRAMYIGRLAAAASLLLIAGGKLYYDYRPPANAIQAIYPKNDKLLDAMLQAHVAAPPGQALSAALSDPVAISKEASQRLGRSTPSGNLGSLGWKADAATIVSIDGAASLRVHYVQGGAAITLLSMPARVYEGASDGSHYELMNNDTPIAGSVLRDSLDCVVGDSSIPLAQVMTLRDTVTGTVCVK